MLSGPDLRAFRKNLLVWFGEFQRALPWRQNKDPYRVWLSEIMLQQTRVAAVIPYYEKFLRQFPTVRALAEASSDSSNARAGSCALCGREPPPGTLLAWTVHVFSGASGHE